MQWRPSLRPPVGALRRATAGSGEISPAGLARLAQMERCGAVIRHIAVAAAKFDRGREDFWTEVLGLLPNGGPPPAGVLPHASRFMIQ